MRVVFALTAFCLFTQTATAADWQLQLSGYAVAQGQAADPQQREQKAPLQQQILLNEQGRYRLERRSTFPGDITFHVLEVGGPEGKKTVDLAGWRTGTETDSQGPDSARISYADLLLLSPALLLKQARELSAVDAKGGQTLQDPAGRTLRLQFDENHDLTAVEVDGLRYQYSHWSATNGLRQPGTVTVKRGGQLLREFSTVRLAPGQIKASDWQLPPGYTTAFARNGLKVVQVEGDLYRLEGSPSTYHMAFAVGSSGIVLFDTPRSKEEGEAMRSQISAAFPDKKVTDIVYSHGHLDHQAGLAAWLDLQPQVWTGAGGRAALLRHVPGSEKLQVQEINTERDVSLAGLTLRLLPVRSNHAHDMVVALLPATGAVLQGDLFMVPNQGPVAAYPTAALLQQLLNKASFSARHIISVHGRVATAAELAESARLSQTQR
jgi:glyoxylase-like metal-dependent hydrolase (beta-lactamase superfamily II)